MKNSLKILSIISFPLIQSYSFADVTTSDKAVDKYIYNKNGFFTACHFDDKMGERFCWDKDGLVDDNDINI
ncbi:hypothetical protein [Arsenophonus apicola]|jgi:hypothetical protein|uniref:hypothetical protein n=1 Tax=Arsenophonus apicola TaxID=2879119 RepID=UPI00387A1B0C